MIKSGEVILNSFLMKFGEILLNWTKFFRICPTIKFHGFSPVEGGHFEFQEKLSNVRECD